MTAMWKFQSLDIYFTFNTQVEVLNVSLHVVQYGILVQYYAYDG